MCAIIVHQFIGHCLIPLDARLYITISDCPKDHGRGCFKNLIKIKILMDKIMDKKFIHIPYDHNIYLSHHIIDSFREILFSFFVKKCLQKLSVLLRTGFNPADINHFQRNTFYFTVILYENAKMAKLKLFFSQLPNLHL